jgi:hypothetical protein
VVLDGVLGENVNCSASSKSDVGRRNEAGLMKLY